MSSKKRSKYEIILNNDTHNTFQHVISCLINICNHNYYQAIQCANIVHNNGKCSIWTDSNQTESYRVFELLQQNELNVELLRNSKK